MVDTTEDISTLLALGPVIPVIVIDDESQAVPLAQALVDGGLTVLEVTLRTPAGLSGIKRIAAEVPDAVVGAGTLLTPADVSAAVSAGSRFLVSPGSTDRVLDAMLDSGVPALPAAATASEVMALLERGLTHAKFFPAQPAGGVAYLRSLAGPLPMVRFCPTGGIDATTAPQFLALSNVACVGGSWMLPADALAARDWTRVQQLAGEASRLPSGDTHAPRAPD
jgi:2-dehydro-3-deoxyphosphogluconate aldolase/(4S)-4-hydroxy-2-oxoglutarate aldolase